MTRLLIGADVGGTSTRAAIATPDGTVLGQAREPGGNPNAVGLQTSALRIRTAIERVLADHRPAEVAAVVLGLAGYNTVIAAGADFLRACLPDQVTVTPRIVSDLGVAYASGSARPDGYVVIAGTGSGAAEIDHGEVLARRGAWGWLLGDEGGGFWLGREAVRLALSETERELPLSDLTRQLLQHFGIDRTRAVDGLLRVAYEQPPIRLAELAPLVTESLDADPAAVAIAARAAATLAELVLDLQPRPGRPIVTTGSVLQFGAIRELFAERVTAATGSPVLAATSGIVGALWLALSELDDRPDPVAHERFGVTLPQAPQYD